MTGARVVVVRIAVVGGPPALRPAARKLATLAVDAGLAADRADALEAGVHELLANALEHGHGGDARIPINLELAVDPDAMQLIVRVTDRATTGVASPPRCTADVDVTPACRDPHGDAVHELALRGRGMVIAADVGTSVALYAEAAGTTAELVVDLDGRHQPARRAATPTRQ